MRNEDLMVGDWFRFRYTIDGKEIVKTFRIRRTADELGYVWGEGFGRMCYPERLEPIPLTQEFLEKNGFDEGYDEDNTLVFEDDDTGTMIKFYPKGTNYTRGSYDYICIERGCITLTEMPIEFVHELQHALRLFRIDMEIIV